MSHVYVRFDRVLPTRCAWASRFYLPMTRGDESASPQAFGRALAFLLAPGTCVTVELGRPQPGTALIIREHGSERPYMVRIVSTWTV